MAWTTPKTWTVGEVLTAANMNLHVRDNENFLFTYGTAYDRASSEIAVVNTTSVTAVYSKSITGGDMSTNRMLRLLLFGDYLNNSGAGATLTISIEFDGINFHSDSVAIGTNTGRRAFRLEFEIGNLGATNSQFGGGEVWLSQAGGATTGIGPIDAADAVGGPIATNGNHAIDTTVAKLLKVVVSHSVADANISFRRKYALLELL